MKHASKLTNMEKAIDAAAPTIAHFNRSKGKPFTEGLLILWLVYLNDMLNLRKPLTEDQIELCAITVVTDYANLKMSDLTLLFKRIISGQYGEFFESLSVAKVLTFFRNYQEERLNLAEEMSIREHNNRMSDDTFNYSTSLERLWYGAKGFNSKK